MLLQRIIVVAFTVQVASSQFLWDALPMFGSSLTALTDATHNVLSDNKCVCDANICDCCVSIHTTMPPTNFCAKTTFSAAPKVDLQVNGQSRISKSISDFVDNSAPLCIPTVPGVEVCVKVYGVELLNGGNNKVCLQIFARVLGNDAIGFDFQCIRFNDGIVSLGSQDKRVSNYGRRNVQPGYAYYGGRTFQ